MWFAAKLIFKSNVDDGKAIDPLCEESIRLVEANNEEEAKIKAEQFGNTNEHEYVNDSGYIVKWIFVRVEEVQDLCESNIYDGMEVFSTLKRI